MLFLSTPSARRATQGGELDDLVVVISIHALREEGDNLVPPTWGLLSRFLSTPSARRATLRYQKQRRPKSISIHALREEGDRISGKFRSNATDFYPRPPRGGRPRQRQKTQPNLKFLSTPSARRATNLYRFIADFGVISIHALREEGDRGLTHSLSLIHI